MESIQRSSQHRGAERICFVSSLHPPRDKRVFKKEAVSLAASGYEVFHLCPGEPDEAGWNDGVTIVTFAAPRGRMARLRSLPRLFGVARRLAADAYHCNELDSWLVGVLLRLVTRRKVIFDCHEHYPSHMTYRLRPGFRRVAKALLRFYMGALGLATHKVIIPSPLGGDLSFSRGRHLEILNAPWVADSGPSPDPAGERPVCRFVHLGVMRRERGSDQLLAAMRELRRRDRADYRVVIVGKFGDGREAEFRARAEEYGVADRLELHPWMPVDRALAIVRRCQVGLIVYQPTLHNNVVSLPHKLFDYMNAGLAVIAPEFCLDIAAVLREADAGVVTDTRDAVRVADLMERLMDRPGRAAELGANGRRAVVQKYNWESEARKLVAMYDELFGSVRERAAAAAVVPSVESTPR